jgi:hypothetical protein
MVPVTLQSTVDEPYEERANRAKAIAAEQTRLNANAAADAYVKTQKAPEEGSGAQELQETLS